jgi:hypothetical protein
LSFVKDPSARDWLGLAVPLRGHALLSGVASLARGGPAAFSVGMLAGAIGTTGMAVLFWFASVPLGARRRVLGFVLIWIPSARCVATDDLNIELSAWRALVLDVHTCARSVDTLTSAVGWIASSRSSSSTSSRSALTRAVSHQAMDDTKVAEVCPT